MRSRDHGNRDTSKLQASSFKLQRSTPTETGRRLFCAQVTVLLCPINVASTATVSCANRLLGVLALLFMSHSHATGSSSPNFQLILNNALDKYKRRTKNDLLAHPLAAQLQSCNSPSAILAVLQQQLQGLGQSQSSDERWSRWLDPTVNVVYAFSSTLAAGAGLVCLRT
jgi:hypothetical protein